MAALALIGLLLLGTIQDTFHQTWTGEPVPPVVGSLTSIPAKWHHDLSSTYLVGYKKGEQRIISRISTGIPGKDAVERYSLMVKVSGWDKPFSTTLEWPDHTTKETFMVTLHETSDPKEVQAEFDHAVYENGKLFLHFSGSIPLVRNN